MIFIKVNELTSFKKWNQKSILLIGIGIKSGKKCKRVIEYPTCRLSVEHEIIDSTQISVAKPGVRYFFSDKVSSEQSFLSEVCAIFLSFCFTGIVPLLTLLFVLGFFSVKARSMNCTLYYNSTFHSSLFHIVNPCKNV